MGPQELRKQRIQAITERLLADMINRGEVNPDNDEDIRRGARECAQMAMATVNAVDELLCG